MGYKFSDRYFSVEIEDKKYSAPVSNKLIEAAKTSSAEFVRIRDEEIEDMEVICKTVDGALDNIFGAGTAASIFEGRELNVYERVDLMIYVLDEISRFTNNYAVSRAGGTYVQRRGKNRNRR